MGRGEGTTNGVAALRREPGTKIVKQVNHDLVVEGREVSVVEIHWNDTDALSFDVYLDNETLLTTDGSLDERPDHSEIRDLIEDYQETTRLEQSADSE